MTPILLGVLAQSGAAAVSAGKYESLMTVTVGTTSQTQIDLTSISSDYDHLEIRAVTKTASAADSIRFRFNDDSTTNYWWHQMYGSGATPGAGAAGAATATPFIGSATYSGTNAQTFAANVIQILDYKNTNKYKTVRSLNGYDINGGGYILLSSALWLSTTAINKISFFNGSGVGDYQQHSQFALYGIKVS